MRKKEYLNQLQLMMNAKMTHKQSINIKKNSITSGGTVATSLIVLPST